MKQLLIAVGVAALAGCMTNPPPPPPDQVPVAATARADLRNSAGLAVGAATATQTGDSIRVRIEGTGLPQGAHGAHIHTTGRCDPPTFTSAGDHWNPTLRRHGRNNALGMHFGDLPNLLIGTDGRGTLEYTISSTSVIGGAHPLLDRDGASIVIHANPDDYRTDPSGNSGARIACGVFR